MCNLCQKRTGAHTNKVALNERSDISNLLNREFELQNPNQMWCGDIAVDIDLYAKRVVGWAISEKPDAIR